MTVFDAKTFDAAMDKAPTRLFKALKTRLVDYLSDFANATMTGKATSNLHRRSGQLAQSFRSQVDGTSLNTLRGTVYTDSVYAATQEFDAFHRPSTRKYLTIPLAGNLTPAGSSRGDANLYKSRPTFLRPHPRGYIMYLKTGKPRPKSKGARDNSIVPLFLLVKRVWIPGRLGFFQAWDAEQEEREELLMDAANEALDGLGRRADG